MSNNVSVRVDHQIHQFSMDGGWDAPAEYPDPAVTAFAAELFATYGRGVRFTAIVRFDDSCNNGHNTFSITASVSTPESRKRRDIEAGSCLHAEVAVAFPTLAPLLRFHLMSADEPMHYIANTTYWLGYDTRWADKKPGSPPNLEYARKSACWPELPESMLAPFVAASARGETGWTQEDHDAARAAVKAELEKRLETLRAELRAAVESLGMVF